MNTKDKGFKTEEFVSDFLVSEGFKILVRNFRTPAGEIDIIAEKGRCLHSVEVKLLPVSWNIEDIALKVDVRKQMKIRRTLSVYLTGTVCKYERISFDVACVRGSSVKLWEGAF